MADAITQIGRHFEIAISLKDVFRVRCQAERNLFETVKLFVHPRLSFCARISVVARDTRRGRLSHSLSVITGSVRAAALLALARMRFADTARLALPLMNTSLRATAASRSRHVASRRF